jgi:mannose-6-phosphate isomerase-like protein (cupin superfamily)
MVDNTIPSGHYPSEIDISTPAHSVLGQLFSLEVARDLGFVAKRFYWITGVPIGAARGNHAHKSLSQFMFMVSGSAVVELKTPHWEKRFKLEAGKKGLFVPPGFWRVISGFSSNAVLGVLASEAYDETDYLRNWEDYVRWAQET